MFWNNNNVALLGMLRAVADRVFLLSIETAEIVFRLFTVKAATLAPVSTAQHSADSKN
jgi:hypothetical protein